MDFKNKENKVVSKPTQFNGKNNAQTKMVHETKNYSRYYYPSRKVKKDDLTIIKSRDIKISKTQNKNNKKYLSKNNFNYDLKGNPIKNDNKNNLYFNQPLPSLWNHNNCELEEGTVNYYIDFINRGVSFLKYFTNQTIKNSGFQVKKEFYDEAVLLLQFLEEAQSLRPTIVKYAYVFLSYCEIIKIKYCKFILHNIRKIAPSKNNYQGLWRGDFILKCLNNYEDINDQFEKYIEFQVQSLNTYPYRYVPREDYDKISEIFSQVRISEQINKGYVAYIKNQIKLAHSKITIKHQDKILTNKIPTTNKYLDYSKTQWYPLKNKEVSPINKVEIKKITNRVEKPQKVKGYPYTRDLTDIRVKSYFSRQIKGMYYASLDTWKSSTSFKCPFDKLFIETMKTLDVSSVHDMFNIYKKFCDKLNNTYIQSRGTTLLEFKKTQVIKNEHD